MALITQDDIEKTLHFQFDNDADPIAAWLVENSSAMVESYCNRLFEEVIDGTVTLDGRGDHTVWLPRTPVTAVASVTENGVVLETTQYAWYTNGRVVRVSYGYDHPWCYKRQSVEIQYTGGYSTIPFDVRAATAAIAAEAFKVGAAFAEQENPGVNLERIGDYMVQYDLDRAMASLVIPDGARRILNNHKRVVVT
jgi:hypothetical protein